MSPVDLHTFVRDLKASKAFTQKQCLVIENLFIYFNDFQVYKVIIAINPNMMKKAKKLGFTNNYKVIYFDDVPIKVDEFNVDKGKYIAVYNPNNTCCTICRGEIDEEEQVKNLKRRNIC